MNTITDMVLAAVEASERQPLSIKEVCQKVFFMTGVRLSQGQVRGAVNRLRKAGKVYAEKCWITQDRQVEKYSWDWRGYYIIYENVVVKRVAVWSSKTRRYKENVNV